jgi:haloacid dehalogenase superfamily, subfamily IA, variant 1 with third motif having Dx(3-4)D or Dx(3-4)E
LDLDDTLYPEITYVKSSFLKVSNYLSTKIELSPLNIHNHLLSILKTNGRGEVFDIFLRNHDFFTKKELLKCISIYRSNFPEIKIYEGVEQLLIALKNYPKYLVTDGNKLVQSKKIKALNLKKFFKKIFITHNYGIKYRKPSLYCFEKIKDRENCRWEEIIYIGDDPSKDFVNLNKKNAITVRVKTGRLKNLIVEEDYEAKIKVGGLSEFLSVFQSLRP